MPIEDADARRAKITLEGIRGGLSIIILVTFSLALFNLLPIPVLDGGHILYALIEMVIRRRLPSRLIGFLQTAFGVMLIGLMLYITFRDMRRLPKFWRAFRGDDATEATTPATPEAPPAEPPATAPAAPEAPAAE